MISVPNLRQQLNGNSTARRRALGSILTLLLVVNFSACELFKPISQGGKEPQSGQKPKDELDPIQGRRVYDPVTGTYVVVRNSPTEPMDTIVWRDIPSSIEPPIYSTAAPVGTGPIGNPVNPIGVGDGNSQLLSSYNVAVVLPFLSDRFSAVDKTFSTNSSWALQFYSGMEMAFDELSAQGIPLNVSVMDSKANEQVVTTLARTNRDLNNAHLIIGPYLRSNVSILAEKARSTGAVLVSPHSASSNVSDKNPNYVQVSPTLESHCQAILQHVLQHFKADQIVLVALNTPNETARFDYFQKEYDRLTGLQNTIPLKRLTIDSTNTTMSSVNLSSWFSNSGETVFIVPSWSQETFIYNLLRRLDNDRSQYQQVTVYGMPQWMEYERIDYDYYEKLNVHVSSSSFIDNLSPDIRQFKRQFYERYGDIPNEEAYSGYDLTRYFGQLINKYGTKFQLKLEEYPEQMLHTKYAFQRILVPTTTGVEFPQVERWENKFVNILKFQNYRFSKAD
jgi:ABC-type branched-subunit amino acid transport system substrate-binding protein